MMTTGETETVTVELPEYMTAAEVARAAGVHIWTFRQHVRHNVGGLADKQQKVPGVKGALWEARSLRKYLGIMAAVRRGKERSKG